MCSDMRKRRKNGKQSNLHNRNQKNDGDDRHDHTKGPATPIPWLLLSIFVHRVHIIEKLEFKIYIILLYMHVCGKQTIRQSSLQRVAAHLQ